MASPDRTISVFKPFTIERPEWTVEEAAAALQVSVSSAYRYFAALTDAGLLTTIVSGRYVLGPAIIQYDRQIQLTDPLLRVAKPVMSDIKRFAPDRSTVLLCCMFRDTVLCIHQVADADGGTVVSYERGRPMPLFRGATSKIILAHLQPRDLRRFYEAHQAEFAGAAPDAGWDAFRKTMAAMRKAGNAVARGEVDAERIGIAAPILDESGRVQGSLSFVISAREERAVARLVSLVVGAAHEIENGLRSGAVGPQRVAQEQAA